MSQNEENRKKINQILVEFGYIHIDTTRDDREEYKHPMTGNVVTLHYDCDNLVYIEAE